MNERLTELYRASRPKEALASQDEFKSANALLGSDVDKFAELIVRECASIAGKAEYSDTWLEPVEDAIKKHFGVE